MNLAFKLMVSCHWQYRFCFLEEEAKKCIKSTEWLQVIDQHILSTGWAAETDLSCEMAGWLSALFSFSFVFFFFCFVLKYLYPWPSRIPPNTNYQVSNCKFSMAANLEDCIYLPPDSCIMELKELHLNSWADKK